MASFRVALVSMPWASAQRGSIALGILKRSLRRIGVASDTHYLNLRMAARMHPAIYETMSNISLLGDWMFAQHLFGPYGTGELASGREDIVRLEGPAILGSLERYQIDGDGIIRTIIPAFLAEVERGIPWDRYAVVAFTSVFVQNVASLLLARRIKDRWPAIRVVMGGANVAGPMGREALRAFDWLDYVVDGEGELVFPELVGRIREGRSAADLPGVSCREGDTLHFASGPAPLTPVQQVPTPDYDEYFAALRQAGLEERITPRILFEGARGCWWGQKKACTFCSQNGQSLEFRAKPARRVLRQLNALARRHQCLNFESVDNVLDPRQLREMFPELIRQERDYKLFYDVRSSLTRRQVAMLRTAGVRGLEVGIEALHDGVLRLMRKGVSAMQNIQMLKWCAEEGISVTWHLLFGLPGEVPGQYTETLETVRKLTHLHPPVTAGRILLQRFSPYFRDPQRWGIRDVRPKTLYKYIYPHGKVRMENLAHHFDWDWADRLPDLERLAAPLQEWVECWREAYRRREIFFTRRRGPGFVELVDNRPLGTSWRIPPPRRSVLTGQAAAVYEICAEAKTVTRIAVEAGRAGCDGPAETAGIQQMLDCFVQEGLMIKSGGRYLSLALPWS